MSDLRKLMRASLVTRYHTHPRIKDQTVAAHSWGVAMTVLWIHPGASTELVRAALVHDLHESEGGDIPYPAKKQYPDLGLASRVQEAQFNVFHGIEYRLTESETKVLKWADMYECYVHSITEANLGNCYAVPIAETAFKVCRETAPNERAAALVETWG